MAESVKRRLGWVVASALGLSAATMLGVSRACADEPRWSEAPYTYVVVDQDLRTVLQEFGNHLGLSVALSEGIDGRVRGKVPPLPPREFLDRLTAMYGLTWYYDGSVLYVVPIKEMVSKLLPLGQVSFAALKASLDSLRIADQRFPIRYSPDSNLVFVAGPARYVELIEQTIGAVGPQKPNDVRIIRGGRQS